MPHKLNLVRVLTTATGTSETITLGSAYSQSFMTPAEAGAIDARTYTAILTDGNNWELVRGAYAASGTTFARTTVLASRSGGTLGTSRISLTGSAQVRFIESAEDMDGVRGTRVVTGTSDVIANTDMGYAITYSNASAIAATIAQAGASSQFLDGWTVFVKNTGAGALTITPATSTINGGASLVLAQNLGAMIWSDGSNYHAFVMPVTKPLLAANNLSDVVSASTARSNLGVSLPHGQCRLTLSGGNLVLSPYNGNLLTVNGVSCTVPDGGVSLAATSLTPGTSYFIYATASGGVVNALEALTTAHATSTTSSNKGTEIKSGDDTRSLVGMARAVTGSAWANSATQRFVVSWFNRARRDVTGAVDTTSTETSGSQVEKTVSKAEFVAWADEVVDMVVTGTLNNSTTTGAVGFTVFFDGAAYADLNWNVNPTGVTNRIPLTGLRRKTAGSDGYHYVSFGLSAPGGGTASASYGIQAQASVG
ncbi:hypothetical protein ACYCVF_29650 [Bradyrhizobium sp. 1.29L]